VGIATATRACGSPLHYLDAVRTDTNNAEFFPGDTPGVVRRGGVSDDLPT
jgi:hypothetical protein